MSWIGTGGAPLTRGAAVRAAGDMEHRALVSDEEPEQLDEPGAVKPAGGAVRRGLNRDRVAHARDGKALLAAQLRAEYRPRRPSRGAVTEEPRRGVRRKARHTGHPPHCAAGGAPAGISEHEVGIGPAADQAQQRFNVRRLDARVLPHELLELHELHLNGSRKPQPLYEQFVSELGEPIFDGGIEILDRLEDGERDDAMHHGARKVASPSPIAELTGAHEPSLNSYG